MKQLNYPGIFILIMLSLGCKNKKCHDQSNPDCDNYNPCYGKNTVIYTNFRVTNTFNGFPPPPKECPFPSYDTLFVRSMRLEVPEGNPNNSIYEWQIGTDTTVYRLKALEIDMIDWLNKGNWENSIPVNLTIKTPPNGCFPMKDTLVKTTRNIFFSKVAKKTAGVFYGTWDGSSKSDTFYAYRNITGLNTFRGSNINSQGQSFCINTPFADSFTTIYEYNFFPKDPCERRSLNFLDQPLSAEGYVYACQTEVVYYQCSRFSYWIRKPGEPEKKYVFTGKFIRD